MREPDWKEFVAPPADMSPLVGVFQAARCPNCERNVAALVRVNSTKITCPQCAAEWAERTA